MWYEHGNAMGWDGGLWPWFMGFHGLFWILLLSLIIFALISLIRDWRRNPGRDAALGTLAEEYARGRISREDFRDRKREIAA